jgi:GNAT superfamily N-acetyltransferase
MAEIKIEMLTDASEETAEQLNALMHQLTPRAQVLDAGRLRKILNSSGSLYVARDGDKIVGTVCRLDLYHPVRTKCWIEDMVVDQNYRGQGIAANLLTAAIEGVPAEAISVNLNSKIDRVDSHRLYSKLGFKTREDTRVWRLELPAGR